MEVKEEVRECDLCGKLYVKLPKAFKWDIVYEGEIIDICHECRYELEHKEICGLWKFISKRMVEEREGNE